MIVMSGTQALREAEPQASSDPTAGSAARRILKHSINTERARCMAASYLCLWCVVGGCLQGIIDRHLDAFASREQLVALLMWSAL